MKVLTKIIWNVIVLELYLSSKFNYMTKNVIEKCKELTKKGKREFDVKQVLSLFNHHGFKFWSWGSSKFTNLEDKGLLFKVNGHHHKGYVFITLDFSDTFDVYIISTHGNVLNEYNLIYVDMLFDTIDTRIEKIPEYVR